MWQTICQKVIFFSWWNLWALRPCSLSFRSRPAAKTIHNPIRFENRKYPRERNFGYAIFVYQTLIIYVLVMKIFNRCPYHLVNSLARWAGCGEILRYLGAEIFKSAYQKTDSPKLFLSDSLPFLSKPYSYCFLEGQIVDKNLYRCAWFSPLSNIFWNDLENWAEKLRMRFLKATKKKINYPVTLRL